MRLSELRRAARAARQLHYHRQRIRWMESKIEENHDLLRTLMDETGEDALIVPGFTLRLTEEGRLEIERIQGSGEYEQLRLREVE
jgi:hypothetical protein